MKAMVWTNYGGADVLKLGELPKPTPKPNEVLIKVRAASVTLGDCEMRELRIIPAFRPLMRAWVGVIRPSRIKVLGMELAGDIEAAGEQVTTFKVGDAVFGTTGTRFGAYAEYACLSATANTDDTNGRLAHKPANLSYEEAATIPVGSLEALHLLRPPNPQPGQKLLIIGAGGNIGTYATQLAKYWGMEITGVDSADKHAFMRANGVAHVVDYRTTDITKLGQTYDVVMDVVGLYSFRRGRRLLTPNGCYVMANPGLRHILFHGWVSKFTSHRLIVSAMNTDNDALDFICSLIEQGHIRTTIDRHYPLEQLPDAHRYLESGRKVGAIVILPQSVLS